MSQMTELSQLSQMSLQKFTNDVQTLLLLLVTVSAPTIMTKALPSYQCSI